MAYTTIDNPEEYFVAKLYTGGNGSATTISGLDFQPDMVWCKGRSVTGVHGVMDDQRSGANGYGWLRTESTDAENNTSGRGNISSWTSDGFVLSADSWNAINYGTNTYVSWCWKESATAGFDIISYAGDGSAGRSLSHALSAVPHFIIIKNRDDAVNWFVYHQGMSDTYNNNLNTTEAQFGGSYIFDPTSSIFKLRDHNVVNDSGDDYIAYCFSEKQGFSKFGTFSGNGSATDGVYIHLGFRAAWFMCKRINASGHDWVIFNNKSLGYNVDNNTLLANSNAVEGTADRMDILSNGVKMYNNNGSENESGGTYIYMAFAEAPFVNSSGVPVNAR